MSDAQQEHVTPTKTALIVDDDSSVRRLLRTVLHRESFDVEEALNGREAIELVRRKHYDAIVLDLMMGPGNGFDVLEAVKAECPGKKCVIVLSAASATMIEAVPTEAVYAKLRKPFDLDELVHAVRECVRG